MSRADARARDAASRKAAVEKLTKAKETLAKTPDDPGANQLVGYYTCAVKGDWAAGLPFLVKGNDPATKAAPSGTWPARRMRRPGGGWATAGGTWRRRRRRPPGRRSVARPVLVREVVRQADRPYRAKVRTRLMDLRQDQFGPKSQWVALNDPKAFGVNAAVGEAMEVTAEPARPRAWIARFRPESSTPSPRGSGSSRA
jgi:hypothetical protein